MFLSIGASALAIGITILFGQAVPLIRSLAPWAEIGAGVTLLGSLSLIAGGVLWCRSVKTSWFSQVRYMTNSTTGDRVFRNLMRTPIKITGVDKSDPNVDHWAIGLPNVIPAGAEVPLNPKRNPPGRSTLIIHWEDDRGRGHRYRIAVTESGPLFSPGPPAL